MRSRSARHRRFSPHSVWIFTTLLAAVAACDANLDTAARDAASPAIMALARSCAPAGHRVELLGTDAYTAWGRTWAVHRLRITHLDGGRTYAQWFPADRPGPRPLVVHAMPYAGIAWTGEALDERWATYEPAPGGTGYLAVDGPAFDGAARIGYQRTPVAVAGEQALPHLLNDLSVLLVYGRFYAGGSVRDDADDMRAGMWLAAELPVDHARVGTFGASWGGFEALQAGGHPDPRAPARVTVALFPPVDFRTWRLHAATRDEPARGALVPHLRRLDAAGGAPAYRGLRAVDLCAGLPADTLVLHDAHDNLVPIAEAHALLAACGGDAVWWPRAGVPDPGAVTHGPMTEEPILPSAYLYAWAYLHLRLSDQPVLEVYAPGALVAHLGLLRDAQRRGDDVAFAAPRLRELCDPRLYLLDAEAQEVLTGAAAVARAVNLVWGTAWREDEIAGALDRLLGAVSERP